MGAATKNIWYDYMHMTHGRVSRKMYIVRHGRSSFRSDHERRPRPPLRLFQTVLHLCHFPVSLCAVPQVLYLCALCRGRVRRRERLAAGVAKERHELLLTGGDVFSLRPCLTGGDTQGLGRRLIMGHADQVRLQEHRDRRRPRREGKAQLSSRVGLVDVLAAWAGGARRLNRDRGYISKSGCVSMI